MANGYRRPQDVTAPKKRWKLRQVLVDDGPDRPAYALGMWDGEPAIGFRWNGNTENFETLP